MSHAHCDAILAYPSVLAQRFTKRYSDDDAIIRGTLFPELDLPFGNYEIRRPLPNDPMTNWMKLDFVCHELRLYLDVHPEDTHAQELYNEYKCKVSEAKIDDDWLNSPWPWEVAH